MKAAVIVGSVYFTHDIGVWGSQTQSEEIFDNIVKTIEPHVIDMKKKLPFDVPTLPPSGEVRFLAKHYYNESIKGTVHFVTMIPCYSGQLAFKIKDTISKAMDDTPNVK